MFLLLPRPTGPRGYLRPRISLGVAGRRALEEDGGIERDPLGVGGGQGTGAARKLYKIKIVTRPKTQTTQIKDLAKPLDDY